MSKCKFYSLEFPKLINADGHTGRGKFVCVIANITALWWDNTDKCNSKHLTESNLLPDIYHKFIGECISKCSHFASIENRKNVS